MKWLINYSFGSHDMERGDLEDQHLPTWNVICLLCILQYARKLLPASIGK